VLTTTFRHKNKNWVLLFSGMHSWLIGQSSHGVWQATNQRYRFFLIPSSCVARVYWLLLLQNFLYIFPLLVFNIQISLIAVLFR